MSWDRGGCYKRRLNSIPIINHLVPWHLHTSVQVYTLYPCLRWLFIFSSMCLCGSFRVLVWGVAHAGDLQYVNVSCSFCSKVFLDGVACNICNFMPLSTYLMNRSQGMRNFATLRNLPSPVQTASPVTSSTFTFFSTTKLQCQFYSEIVHVQKLPETTPRSPCCKSALASMSLHEDECTQMTL